jgi:hypothetical protein
VAFNLSNADNILKVFYLGPIREQLNNATVLLSRIDKDESTQDAYGKTFTVPLRTGRNVQAGSGRADGGVLPSYGQQGYTTAVVPNKYVYAGIEVTGPTIRATRNNAGAFVKAIESEIKGCVRDMKRAINRQLHSDGSDALAFWTAADNTSGFSLDDDQGNAFLPGLQTGMVCDVIDQSDYSTKLLDSATFTVGAKGASSYSVTTSANPSGTADRDFAVLEDTLGYQMMGIRGIVSNVDPVIPAGGGTKTGLHGLAAATYAWWNAQVFDNSGTNRALTLELMQDPLSEISVSSDFSESDVKFLLTNVWMRDKYLALCQANRQQVNTMKLDGGFEGVEFNGKPIIVDTQCHRNRIYYITPETMKIFRTSDFDWMEEDGNILQRKITSSGAYDAYNATLFHYGDLACVARNGNGLLADITD